MKTKEEIIAKVCKYNNTHEMQLNDDITVEEAMECMEEYANQQLQLGGVVGQSEQLNCQHEWNWGSFDCFGFLISKYCDKCGKEEAI